MYIKTPAKPNSYTYSYYQNNHLGTPQQLLSFNSATVWQGEYDAFGEISITNNQIPQPLRFAGQYHDSESNLYYNWHRYYNPKLGRYISSDPIGLDGGMNRFGYVGGKPLVRFDSLGLAYFAKRPLSGLPWLEPLSRNSWDDKSNSEISHEHLFLKDGKSPRNIGFGPDGLFTETNSTGYRKQDSGYSDCIMRIAYKRVPPGEYKLFSNNCQTWAQKVSAEYNRIKNGPEAKQCKECTP